MIEKIYTIPVSEAFETDSECALCRLESRFEDECAEYYLGPSLMEPDNREVTNEKGFCRSHFSLLYNKQVNRLGLGLVLDTYMQEQIMRLGRLSAGAVGEKGKNLFTKLSAKNPVKSAQAIGEYIEKHEKECAICSKLNYTMDRYLEVIMHLYFSEDDFKIRFNECKGFCIPHFKMLLEASGKYHSGSKSQEFCEKLITLELTNLERIEKETDWFTKKFDYRNTDAPWGNSKDALQRGINKMTGSKLNS
jgi:hypothetical protein